MIVCSHFKNDICQIKTNFKFDSYEEALEYGIGEVLEMI